LMEPDHVAPVLGPDGGWVDVRPIRRKHRVPRKKSPEEADGEALRGARGEAGVSEAAVRGGADGVFRVELPHHQLRKAKR
jgi:hypothetical protein